ncbi:MAG: peptidoglycan-binding protein [bacterium]|nr:peptidoglycan-binding protein [bacterium]
MLNKLLLIATVISLSGAGALLPMTVHGATLQEQITALLAQVAVLQAQLASGGTSAAGSSYSYTRDLTVGSKGDDVTALQNALGVSPATSYFGPKTKAALATWQAANEVSPAAGYFGARTRAKMAGGLVPTPVAMPVLVPIPAPEAATSTPAATFVVTLPNPFESTLKIETTYQSTTLSTYGEKTLTAFKVSADEKIAITKIRFKNNGTYGNNSLTKFKLLANADSGPVLAEADISQGIIEFKLTPDIAKENNGLIVSGNSYYVRSYLVTYSFGEEKPYIRLDIESVSDISAYDYNDLNRVATITKNNSFPILGPRISAF